MPVCLLLCDSIGLLRVGTEESAPTRCSDVIKREPRDVLSAGLWLATERCWPLKSRLSKELWVDLEDRFKSMKLCGHTRLKTFIDMTN
jgi:hypothetical protein